MAIDGKEKIVLGSGKLFGILFSGDIPNNDEIEKDDNLVGLIQGGASLEYKPTFYTAKDDLGLKSKTIMTEEEATLKSGIMTWCGKTLDKFCNTARITEDKEKGLRIVKIGGAGNQDGKRYLFRFYYHDEADGDIRITIVGQNEAGFTIAFAKDKETVIDAEFKAQPHDKEGTLILYEEDIPKEIKVLTITSQLGSQTGDTKITVDLPLDSGNSYVYKVGDSLVLPKVDEVCGSDYSSWDGTSEITAANGKDIVIVEVDSNSKAVKAGKTAVISQ